MNKLTKLILAIALIAGFASSSTAGPIQLNSSSFATAISGVTCQVEDFEGFSGGQPAPFTFSNATYNTSNGVNGATVVEGSSFCDSATDNCLVGAEFPLNDLRTFNGFAAGTTHFGVSMTYIRTFDVISVTVTGVSGILNLSVAGQAFFGFADTLGITSVVFQNLGDGGGGFGNYGFDDVTTASVEAVPEPETIGLLGLGLVSLVLSRRRRIKA